MTCILGAVIAGGAARRFGSDKALAEIAGQTLIDRVIAVISPQVDTLVVCGRAHRRHRALDDRPGGRLGPLAGIAAALFVARSEGFAAVLSAPCDILDCPEDLLGRFTDTASGGYLDECPVVALWPVAVGALLDAHLATGHERSVRRFAASIGLRGMSLGRPLANINTPADLRLFDRDR